MGMQPLLDAVAAVSAKPTNLRVDLSRIQPQTPPRSTSGSPRIKLEGLYSNPQYKSTSLPGLLHLHSPCNNPQFKLPSIGEFDQGVEALVRTHGPVNSWAPPSPLPSLSRGSSLLQSSPTSQSWPRTLEDPASELFTSRRGTITGLSQYAIAGEQIRQPPQGYISSDKYPGFNLGSPSLQGWDSQGMDCYPSPPPEGENRHINQKYTTEEGDFIIFAWHDKKMKWQRIKQEFAARFGRTPERTVQGLQAWYYRMNQRIPVWDDDGWLIFENDEDMEPKQIGIKCRERDTQDKPMEPLGLAQRYPERAVNYSWVDPELKIKARDWANKRNVQFRERRERRRRKEQRRLKL